MPSEGVKLLTHKEILRHEEIYNFTKVAVKYGIANNQWLFFGRNG